MTFVPVGLVGSDAPPPLHLDLPKRSGKGTYGADGSQPCREVAEMDAHRCRQFIICVCGIARIVFSGARKGHADSDNHRLGWASASRVWSSSSARITTM